LRERGEGSSIERGTDDSGGTADLGDGSSGDGDGPEGGIVVVVRVGGEMSVRKGSRHGLTERIVVVVVVEHSRGRRGARTLNGTLVVHVARQAPQQAVLRPWKIYLLPRRPECD